MTTRKTKKADAKPKKEAAEQVICTCGCVNFHAYTDGTLVCVKCGTKK